MEAYFYQDPGIQEHIEQIIEKLFAVCLLTGSDADAEFQRGLKSASKLVAALASLSSLSEEEIYNGVRQIIEQRLPDSRVIENFPLFYEMMEKMIAEAVLNHGQNPNAPVLPPTQSAFGGRINIIDGRSSMQDSKQIKIRDYQNPYRESVQVATPSPETAAVQKSTEYWRSWDDAPSSDKEIFIDNENLIKAGTPELTGEEVNTLADVVAVKDEPKVGPEADMEIEEEEKEKEKEKEKIEIEAETEETVETKTKTKTKTETEVETQEQKKAETVIMAGAKSELEAKLKVKPDVEAISKPVRRPIQVPAGAERLALVLSQVFPKSPVRWNITLAGYNFLAQVEDVLVYIDQALHGSEVVRKMRKEGWVPIICAQDDLTYPRRLEREIRRSIQRKNSKVKTAGYKPQN